MRQNQRVAHQVIAEIVGSVATVDVTVGDAVTPDFSVVLLESMKMEIPVLAEVAGVVREVRVKPGDVIREGDVLVVIDPA